MKNILVTGGTRGIGRAITILFAKNNYRVFIFYKKSKDIALQLTKEYGIIAYQVDVSDEKSVNNAIDNIIGDFKHIDVLINNAGISLNDNFNNISYEQWHSIIDCNLSSVFYSIKAVLPNMISRQQGKIINISSIWGIRGASCEAHYAASKAGIDAITRSLARELGPSNINVNSIACGIIDTDMNNIYSQEELYNFINELPLMRIGKSEEVAKLAYFIASEDASYITGQVICIDGGYTA